MKGRPKLSAPLQGVIVAAVTPRRAEQHSIDLGATLELIDFLASSGAHAIALLGPAGEFVHFALDDRRHMVTFAAKRSRVPLLINVSHSTLDGAVELAREAASAGAAALLLMPPHYYRYGADAIRTFYLAFAAAVGQAAPIYIGNAPRFTNELPPALAAELLASGFFAGIVDASGDVDAFQFLAQRAGQTRFTLLGGEERIYVAARRMGAAGVVSSAACPVPELMLALETAIREGVEERVRRLEARLIEFLDWIESFPPAAAVKEAAKQRGVKAGVVGAPLGQQDDYRLGQFREWFRTWLPAVLRDCQR
ncbi:MAG TPA: dihydrodipicolinate synthase family protein [Bryobacteraceae bacterium]|nr:dihydrodipicolinate synthase family protein [Bryobacteraceae bacterium]